MFDKRKIVALAFSVIFMMPNFIGLSHIFFHQHEHHICKAIGEKHFHKLQKKCCDNISVQNTSYFVNTTYCKKFDAIVFKKHTAQKPDNNNIVFIASRSSRAPPTISSYSFS